MSQENVEVVLRSISTFDDDVDAWLDTLDPEIEWTPLEEGTPSFRHGSVTRVRQRWLDSWGDHQLDAEDVLDNGDHVVEFPHFYVHFKLRDGKIVYIFEHQARRRGPRSRRASGVGDVAGERGDRAAGLPAR